MITREQIKALPAGRQLDGFIAETVMGMKLDRKDGAPVMWTMGRIIPMFSTSMPDAWKVVETMNERGYALDMFLSHVFSVAVKDRDSGRKLIARQSSVEGAPHAVCIASLIALLFPLDEAKHLDTEATAAHR